jgi:radical SAM protein with 4Fe4S-binding SPASM domain
MSGTRSDQLGAQGCDWAPVERLRVRIELAYRCNLRCRMCDFSLPEGDGKLERAGGPVVDLSPELFDRVCHEVLVHAHECVLGVRAEPMMSRRFLPKLARIAGTGVPIIKLHTNGTLLNERAAAVICDVRVDTVIISVDGASAYTFEAIRNARLHTVLRNQSMLIRKRGAREVPRIQWNFVMMRRNLRELPALMDLAAANGVQSVRAFHMVAHGDLQIAGESCGLCPEETNEVLSLARERARILGIAAELPPPFPVGVLTQLPEDHARTAEFSPRHSTFGPICGLPWEEVMIDHQGRIFPCVFWYKDPPLGNLQVASFEEIWNGAAYRALRAMPTHAIDNFSCNHCPVAAGALRGMAAVVSLP